MSNYLSKNPLMQKIVEGTANEEIKELLIAKQLPFTEEEFLEGLVFLIKEAKYKNKCLELLNAISESIKANYVRKVEAHPRVVYFVLSEALLNSNAKIVAIVIRNRMVPVEFLEKVAEKGNVEMLEILIENQIKMIAFPYILDIMEKNPKINNFVRGKITEVRDFYLREDNPEEISEEAVIEDAKEIMIDTLEEEEESDYIDDEDYKKEAVSLLMIINKMSTSERIKMALTGTRSHRMILIKDPNKMVAMSVLESPKITGNEVVMLIQNKSISGDIVTRISANREWCKRYDVILGLVKNPKTTVSNALGFIKRLQIRDLQLVMRDKNLSPVIRNLAVNHHRERSRVKK